MSFRASSRVLSVKSMSSTAVITSPAVSPAQAAGESMLTEMTSKPPCSSFRIAIPMPLYSLVEES